MAFQENIKISIQDTETGYYYYATLQPDGSYTFALSASIQYVGVPAGWTSLNIEWQRHPQYMGVFRSNSIGTLKYTGAARGIITGLKLAQGIQAQATLVIWLLNQTDGSYSVCYASEFDFTTYVDYRQTQETEIGTLDSQLYRLLQAYGGTEYNIPFWALDASNPDDPFWSTDAIAITHPGIKLLYSSNFQSSASPTNILNYTGGNQMGGFNHGNHGSGGALGVHTIPAMTKYNIVQNNGTTTYIGNDILQSFIVQNNQTPGVESTVGAAYEVNFAGGSNSRPYTTNNNCIFINYPSAPAEIDFDVSVSGIINGTINVGDTGTNQYLGFVLFEIGPQDVCTYDPAYLPSEGHFLPFYIHKLSLPNTDGIYTPPDGGVFSNYNTPASLKLKNGYCYIFSIIYDNDAGVNGGTGLEVQFSNLQFSIFSLYNSGTSAKVDAPFYPPNSFLAYRPGQLLAKLAPMLPTLRTDAYGFPIPVTTAITGVSNGLNNAAATPIYDAIPFKAAITSAYAVHDLGGQSYITVSINDLFDSMSKLFQYGLSIEQDSDGNQTILRMEPMSYYLNASAMLMDLGYDVYGITTKPLTSNLGANLKAGYTKADTNTDFGVDAFCSEYFFNTPLSVLPGIMDFEEDTMLAEMYAMEKIRAQQTSQPIGTSFDPQSPSSDNQLLVFYLNEAQQGTASIYDPGIPAGSISPGVPSYNIPPADQETPNFIPQTYPTAQSLNPAGANPYIYGLYYPDTAINVPLSPGRNLRRNGGMIHGYMDKNDSNYLIFRNTSVMQYNNVALGLSGIQSCLDGSGNVITEFADILIGDLDAPLFKPTIISFTTQQPVNMYQIIQSNPNGYIQCAEPGNYEPDIIYKGFIWKVRQSIGDQVATGIELLACPGMDL